MRFPGQAGPTPWYDGRLGVRWEQIEGELMTNTPTNAQLHIKPLFATRQRTAVTSMLIVLIVLTGCWDFGTPGTGARVIIPTAVFILWTSVVATS